MNNPPSPLWHVQADSWVSLQRSYTLTHAGLGQFPWHRHCPVSSIFVHSNLSKSNGCLPTPSSKIRMDVTNPCNPLSLYCRISSERFVLTQKNGRPRRSSMRELMLLGQAGGRTLSPAAPTWAVLTRSGTYIDGLWRSRYCRHSMGLPYMPTLTPGTTPGLMQIGQSHGSCLGMGSRPVSFNEKCVNRSWQVVPVFFCPGHVPFSIVITSWKWVQVRGFAGFDMFNITFLACWLILIIDGCRCRPRNVLSFWKWVVDTCGHTNPRPCLYPYVDRRILTNRYACVTSPGKWCFIFMLTKASYSAYSVLVATAGEKYTSIPSYCQQEFCKVSFPEANWTIFLVPSCEIHQDPPSLRGLPKWCTKQLENMDLLWPWPKKTLKNPHGVHMEIFAPPILGFETFDPTSIISPPLVVVVVRSQVLWRTASWRRCAGVRRWLSFCCPYSLYMLFKFPDTPLVHVWHICLHWLLKPPQCK